ncbi:hypothetical protein BC833DRAFT_568528 [Globomyces pollinis-pini]|nr:hypothetical protein BC833DRAFT_568528 [Globomyces pollinis-pini]
MQITVLLSILSLAIASPLSIRSTDDVLTYDGYKLQYSCERITTDRWSYTLTPTNKGSAPRPNDFYFDPNYPRECQQKSTKSYGRGYDRGHLVTSNHMDLTTQSRRQSHYITNVLPQVADFNQRVWLTTEKMTECYRLQKPVAVYGGVIYNDDSNDYFIDSHNVRTPDLWWKVLVSVDARGNDQVISWIFPNEDALSDASNFVTTVAEIEQQLDDGLGPIPIKDTLKKIRGDVSKWPTRC